MRKILLGFIFFIAMVSLAGCREREGDAGNYNGTENGYDEQPSIEVHRFDEYGWGMDTRGDIAIFHIGQNTPEIEAHYRAIAREAFEIFETFDLIFDRFNPESDIGRINASRGEWVEVSHHTISIIESALEFREMSNGFFDITIGAVANLWQFADVVEGEGFIPAQRLIDNALETVGSNIYMEGNRVRLGHPDAMLDLGGIAKGYAADYIAAFLVSRGVESAIVNLMGDIAFVGTHPTNSFWGVSLSAPFEPMGTYRYAVGTNAGSVVSSGVYARAFIYNDRLYHHILDVNTGFPSDLSWGSGNVDVWSVSIVSSSAMMGEFLTTAVFTMDDDSLVELLGVLDGVAIVVQLSNGQAEGFIFDDEGRYIIELFTHDY